MARVAVALLAAATMAVSDRALAAGSAYQVDTGVISSPGACNARRADDVASNNSYWFGNRHSFYFPFKAN